MEHPRSLLTVRNLLVGGGAYYLSWWVANPLYFGFGKLTQGIIYPGNFAGAVLLPIVTSLPVALIAAFVGASVVWLVDSETPLRWAAFPVVLYAYFAFRGFHWATLPMFIDRVEQAVTTLFLALSCLCGAILADRKRATLVERHRNANTI
jgi:hypothetical protein